MPKNIRIAIAIVLVIIAVVMVRNAIKKLIPSRKTKVISLDKVLTQEKEILSTLKSTLEELPRKFSLKKIFIKREGKLSWGRDPFFFKEELSKKEVSALLKPSNLKLTGIILAGSKKDSHMAVINNEILKVGDEVLGMRIEEIRENYVILKKDDQSLRLELWEELEK